MSNMRYLLRICKFSPRLVPQIFAPRTLKPYSSIKPQIINAAPLQTFTKAFKNLSTKVDKSKNIEDRVLSIFKSYESLGTKEIYLPFLNLKRYYSHDAPKSLAILEKRIMLVLKLYDKINPDKITVDSNFITDLALDSLDLVEVIMAIEDEFEFEIPDVDAEKFHTPKDIIRYVADKQDVYE